MTKKYSARSQVSLTVYLPNGAIKHISFNQLTGGGSTYYTSDVNEQIALESHSKFGRLFKLESIVGDAPKAEPIKKNEETKVEAMPAAGPLVRKVNISCLADAKEYLADNYGVSRSKLRGEASIKAAAKANNIEFIGI